ncbi:Interleukin-1 beta [Varanus komodoensis]|nr:Interleukin-1 beta [Varanus komodoensis]
MRNVAMLQGSLSLVLSASSTRGPPMARVPECGDVMMDLCSQDEMPFYDLDQPALKKCSSLSAGLSWLPLSPQEGFSGLRHQAGLPQVCNVGIQMRVTQKPSLRGFQKALVITVAVERLKNSRTVQPRPFSDDDLLDIFNSVLEPVDVKTSEFTHAANSTYRFSEDVCCDIQDIDHKSLVLQKEPLRLLAVHLQGPNLSQAGKSSLLPLSSHALRLKMSVYRPKTEAGTGKTPVALSIRGQNLYLCCVQKDGRPELQLEEANIQGNLDKSKLGRFLFYKMIVGKHTRFESAAFPHWYICTASSAEEPVGVTNRLGEAFIVDYKVTTHGVSC